MAIALYAVETFMRDSVPEPNRSSLPRAAQPWSVEQDAEHLMDDLFANVDVLLEGSSQPPHQLVQPVEPGNPSAVSVKATTVATTAISPRKTQRTLRNRSPRPKAGRKSTKGIVAQSALTWPTHLRAWRTRLWQHLDKVCFGIACVSLGGAVVWLVQQERLVLSSMAVSVNRPFETNAVVPPLSVEDAQFTQYMLRSLRVIDQYPSQTPLVARAAPARSGKDEDRTVATASPQIIERIYIPVYAPQTPNSTANSATLPPTDQRETTSRDSASTAVPAAPDLAPEPTARRSELPPPNLDTIPSLESVAPLPSLPSEVVVHSFAGIIQAGDRTTVLFTVDGKTQRIAPGEAIGSSGWTLVSADGQTAVIRRNGEVRSVYNGQRF
ncbi:MAG: hypothetical protein AAGG51_18610 [Cyanobacteria bacterium P01_G01_bin.54]